MADQWYFERDGAPAGPVALGELQQLARTGVVSRDTRVWSEGMSDWVAAGSVARVFDAPSPAVAEPAFAGASGAEAYPPAPAYQPAAQPLAREVGFGVPSHGMSLVGAGDVEKMVANMRFVGIFTIIYGALTCLGIITAIIGVPLVIAGLRLREAADQFERYAHARDEASLAGALERQGSYFYIQKVFILIALAFTALYILFVIFIFGTIGLGALSGR